MANTITLEMLQTRIATRLGIENPTVELLTRIKNELKVIIPAVADDIIKKDTTQRDKYIKETDIAFTNNEYDLTLIADYKDILYNTAGLPATLYVVGKGRIVGVPREEIDNLVNNDYWKNTYACAKVDNKLKLYVPEDFSYGVSDIFRLQYIRKVAGLNNPTDIIDIDDIYADDIIKRVVEILNPTEPVEKTATQKGAL